MPAFIGFLILLAPSVQYSEGHLFWFLCCLVCSGCDRSRRGRALRRSTNRIDVFGVDTNAFLLAADLLEADDTVDLGVDRMVLANTDIVADPEFGAALANYDGAGANELAVISLHTQALRRAVAAVARAADAFLMSHCSFRS